MDLSKILSPLAGLFGLGYSIKKDHHLTGAQREANDFTADQNQKAMDFSAEQAAQQMNFQREMSNTQWLRGVSDMQSAGLNPALAYGQGGASAMQGASGNGSAGSSVDPGRGTSLAEILQFAKLKADLDLTNAQRRNVDADTENTEAVTAGQKIDNLLKETYGADRADAEIRNIEQAINESVARTGEAATRSALNNAMADLTRVQTDNERFIRTEKEWRAKFIRDYRMTPELAGDLVKAAATLVGAGVLGVGKILDRFTRKKGTHTRSITERQKDGTTITDTFTGFPDL